MGGGNGIACEKKERREWEQAMMDLLGMSGPAAYQPPKSGAVL